MAMTYTHRISLALALGSAACSHAAPAPPSNKLTPAAESRAVSDVLGFLPLDADIVLGVDIQALRKTALWTEYQPQLTQAIGPQLAIVQRRCGFDPIQSIESVTLAAYIKETSSPVVVVRGLERDRTIACLESKVIPDTTVANDRGVISLADKSGPSSLVAFADQATLVVQSGKQSTPDGVRAVLRSGAPLRGSAAFVSMYDQLERGATLWMVINGRSGVFDALGSAAAHPRAVYGTVHLTSGVAAKFHIRMATAGEASQFATMAQAQTQQAAAMFDRLEVVGEGDVVTITAEMSLAKLRTAVSLFLPIFGSTGTP
jgi:hypothetical protein